MTLTGTSAPRVSLVNQLNARYDLVIVPGVITSYTKLDNHVRGRSSLTSQFQVLHHDGCVLSPPPDALDRASRSARQIVPFGTGYSPRSVDRSFPLTLTLDTMSSPPLLSVLSFVVTLPPTGVTELDTLRVPKSIENDMKVSVIEPESTPSKVSATMPPSNELSLASDPVFAEMEIVTAFVVIDSVIVSYTFSGQLSPLALHTSFVSANLAFLAPGTYPASPSVPLNEYPPSETSKGVVVSNRLGSMAAPNSF
jgi:hypothetical protein